MLKIGIDDPRSWLPLFLHQCAKELIVRGGRSGPGVLRIQREKQDLVASGLYHLAHLGLGRRVAVTHTVIDFDAVAVLFGHALSDLGGLRLGDGQQRAFVCLFVPDRLVRLARRKWPLCQNDQLQQRLPFPARVIDDTLIRQEFVQITAHRPVIRVVRSPEVGQQHTHTRGRQFRVVAGRVVGAGGIKHGYGPVVRRFAVHIAEPKCVNRSGAFPRCPRRRTDVVPQTRDAMAAVARHRAPIRSA